ncbi:LLM class flavin-dependent oxidoreductase [Actinoallomurus bryophytorum]|uniref:5,10-methylenetetrahydromethanopterin reductase n=1 Tax=Actinoallomurus bryophytorum TaxID=1490222 RepID=A0A543C1I9_9ACTN|nr:LLM class flavin-dependent oxidoreductase [Actinoallomurus bryophytorum]TQL90934.1 5,10-methylenetetrahydromethanopterin reductase [Actinoallomurus bryophytorum]
MTSRPGYSCALPGTADVVEKAKLAERLGYRRVWLFDSPALHGDMWVALARIAAGTDRIGLATGVAVPGLRHPMATASAIGSVHELAPGRLVVAFGTGFTARHTLGMKPISWAALTCHVRQVRALLDGEVVDIDGEPCQMMQSAGSGPPRPINVPLWVAASGPKGIGAARELNVPGVVMTSIPPQSDHGSADPWTERALLRFGTVLRPGEDHTSSRVIEAAGPGYASIVHAVWQNASNAVDALPGGRAWRASIEAERPEGHRHLVVHQGHLSQLTERDRGVVAAAGPGILEPGWTGDAASTAARFEEAGADGVTEIVYVPAGPDIPGELTAFAAAANS